jgi:diaminopimelate epimerase
VDFIQKKDDTTIILRTYERGVEDETLACGTGCVASALLCTEQYAMHSPIHIIPTGKKLLTVFFTKEANTYSDIWLEGETQLLFHSTITIDNDTYAIK